MAAKDALCTALMGFRGAGPSLTSFFVIPPPPPATAPYRTPERAVGRNTAGGLSLLSALTNKPSHAQRKGAGGLGATRAGGRWGWWASDSPSAGACSQATVPSSSSCPQTTQRSRSAGTPQPLLSSVSLEPRRQGKAEKRFNGTIYSKRSCLSAAPQTPVTVAWFPAASSASTLVVPGTAK